MHHLDEKKPLEQAEPILLESPKANEPIWPPPPRPRAAQGGFSKKTKIIAGILAALLVFGALGFLIYLTTSQYGNTLQANKRSNATATVRGQLNSQATRSSQQTATAGPLETANAQIYATATAQAQPTATAQAADAQSTATAQDMAALLTKDTSGTPALNDPLSDNSQGNVWDVGYTDNNNTGCNFVDGSYQVLEALPDFLRPCFADATNFSNFVYQVSLTLNSNCAGGLILRGNKDTSRYYLFMLFANGSYIFEAYNGSKYSPLASGTNEAILSGVGQTNSLTVIANQGVFRLFVNQTYLASAIDGQLKSGQIGVVAYNTSLPASASFSSAELWKLS